MSASRKPLTDEQKDEIVARYERGDTVVSIARDVGKTRQTVHTVLKERGAARPKVRPYEHGTVGGWWRHYRTPEPPCEACDAAWRKSIKERWESMTPEQREEQARRIARLRRRRRVERQKRARKTARAKAQREAEVQAALPETLERLGKSLGLGE